MSKAITSFAIALIIEKWNQVLSVPSQVPFPFPALPWTSATIESFLQICPPSLRPEPIWARYVYADGQPMTIESKLVRFIKDHLSLPYGRFVKDLTLQNLVQHHSFIQPADWDASGRELWNWLSRTLAQGLSESVLNRNEGDMYRNENYTILRAVIQSLSGMEYQDYIRSHVLTPAGAVNFTMQNGDPQLMEHTPTRESSPIVHDHIGFGLEPTPAGAIYTGNGHWDPGAWWRNNLWKVACLTGVS